MSAKTDWNTAAARAAGRDCTPATTHPEANIGTGQNLDIYQHMRKHGSITALEALNEYGCMRLGARIYDLKGAGVEIGAETVTTKSGKRVSSYFLK